MLLKREYGFQDGVIVDVIVRILLQIIAPEETALTTQLMEARSEQVQAMSFWNNLERLVGFKKPSNSEFRYLSFDLFYCSNYGRSKFIVLEVWAYVFQNAPLFTDIFLSKPHIIYSV